MPLQAGRLSRARAIAGAVLFETGRAEEALDLSQLIAVTFIRLQPEPPKSLGYVKLQSSRGNRTHLDNIGGHDRPILPWWELTHVPWPVVDTKRLPGITNSEKGPSIGTIAEPGLSRRE